MTKIRLFTQVFRVDAQAFSTALEQNFGHGKQHLGPQELLHRFLTSLGLKFPKPTHPTYSGGSFGPSHLHTEPPPATAGHRSPQRAAFYSNRTGVLFVRAPLEELDVIQRALTTFSTSSPSLVRLSVKVCAVTSQDLKALGIRRLEHPTLRSRDRILWPHDGTCGAVLTDAQFGLLVKALRQRPGAKFHAVPTATTESGRPVRTSPTQGFTVDLVPSVLSNGRSILLSVLHAYRFPGPSAPGKPRTVGDSDLTALPTDEVLAVLEDRHTLVLSASLGNVEQPPPGKAQAAQRHQILLTITPTIIDAAGNRVHPPPSE